MKSTLTLKACLLGRVNDAAPKPIARLSNPVSGVYPDLGDLRGLLLAHGGAGWPFRLTDLPTPKISR
jgi:hypothetical protein